MAQHLVWISGKETVGGWVVCEMVKGEHECTHRLPGSVPTGISNSKYHTWICVGVSH